MNICTLVGELLLLGGGRSSHRTNFSRIPDATAPGVIRLTHPWMSENKTGH